MLAEGPFINTSQRQFLCPSDLCPPLTLAQNPNIPVPGLACPATRTREQENTTPLERPMLPPVLCLRATLPLCQCYLVSVRDQEQRGLRRDQMRLIQVRGIAG